MEQIIFTGTYRKSFGEKFVRFAAPTLIFIFILMLISVNTHQELFFSFLCALMLIFNTASVYQSARYYIYSIRLNDGQLIIQYTDFDTEKTISGPVSAFTFKLRNTMSRTPSFYLVVFYERKKIVVQRTVGEWNNKSIKSCYAELVAARNKIT